jgi:hypothetical protein
MATGLFVSGAPSPWALAFVISGASVVHPVVYLILIHVTNKREEKQGTHACANCGYGGLQRRPSQHSSTFSIHGKLYSSCPRNLASLTKIENPPGQVE